MSFPGVVTELFGASPEAPYLYLLAGHLDKRSNILIA